MTRGQVGSLRLTSTTLAFANSRRFIPAHPNQCPNGSRSMVFRDELVHIHGSLTHLLSVHVANQRLLAGCIFLAHAASLRQTFYFARREFSEVSSQLKSIFPISAAAKS